RGKFGIALACELEQVSPLGGREMQRIRDARQGVRGHRDIATLLEPGVPSRTQAGELGYFFATQSWRPAPSWAAIRGSESLPVRTKKRTDQTPLLNRGSHRWNI